MPKKTYTQINSVTLAAASSSVTFSSIPQSFRDLIVVVTAQRTGSPVNLGMRLNSDTGSNYNNVFMGGDGSTTFSGSFAATNFQLDSRPYAPTSGFNNYIIQIMDYSATDKQKVVLNRVNGINESIGAAEAWAYRWTNTVAVNTITLSMSSINTGSTFTIYGIEA